MKHKKILSAVLAVMMLCSGAAALQAAGHTPEGEAEVVTESLTNYRLGYMSWGVKKMGLDKLQKKLEASGKELPEVRVAVIDTGLNTSNKYLQGRYTEDGYNFVKNNTNIFDDNNHGTMVSGIIADGTTSNVKILPIKANNQDGSGKMEDVKKAIYYAIEHNADVINMSLSAEDKNHSMTILDDAIDAALAKGIVVVAAAGNQGGNVADRYPANKDSILTIGSINQLNHIARSSNRGATVDFALPGALVTAPSGNAIEIASGTSFSAPHAAAAAALLKTWDKSLTQDDIEGILKQYAVDMGKKGYDETYGWGMIDLSSFGLDGEPDASGTCLLRQLQEALKNRLQERFGVVG